MNRCEFLLSVLKQPSFSESIAGDLIEELKSSQWMQLQEHNSDQFQISEWILKNDTLNGVNTLELDRMTDPESSYCIDRCGMYNSCVRRNEKDYCKEVKMYERLKLYENSGLSPAFVEMVFQKYLQCLINQNIVSCNEQRKGGE